MRNLLTYIHERLLVGVPQVVLWDDRTAVEGYLHDCEATLWPEATLAGLAAAIDSLQDVQAVRLNPFDLPAMFPDADAGDYAAAAELCEGLQFVVYPSDETRVEYFLLDGPDWSTGEFAPATPPAHLTSHQRGILAVPTGALPTRD